MILLIDICHDYFNEVSATGSFQCYRIFPVLPGLCGVQILLTRTFNQGKSYHLLKVKGSNKTNLICYCLLAAQVKCFIPFHLSASFSKSPMGAVPSFSVKNIFYDKVSISLFYFCVAILFFQSLTTIKDEIICS